jgi:hypothetical protein
MNFPVIEPMKTNKVVGSTVFYGNFKNCGKPACDRQLPKKVQASVLRSNNASVGASVLDVGSVERQPG